MNVILNAYYAHENSFYIFSRVSLLIVSCIKIYVKCNMNITSE